MNKRIIFMLLLTIMCLLTIPNIYAYGNGREVIVRHIDKATGDIISGLSNASQEVINSSGVSSLITNSDAEDISKSEFPYNEYYNYENSSTMNITKTLVMQVDGVKYEYLGCYRSTRFTLEEAYEDVEKNKSAYRAGLATLSEKGLSFKTEQSDSNDVTIIDFYYNKKQVDTVSPKLYSNTDVFTSSDAELTSSVTYIPSGRALYPYFSTPEYIVKDLSYEKVINSNGKINYQVNNFIVYRIEEAYLKSSESKHLGADGSIEITGDLVGSEISSAIGGASKAPMMIKSEHKNDVTNNINNVLNDSNNLNKIPGDNIIDSKGKNTNESFYETWYTIPTNRLNGLRSAKGNVIYQEYNVLNGAYGATREYESTNDHYINIFTPVKLNDPQVTVTSESAINHSSFNSSTVILADDATFEVKLSCGDLDFQYYNNITPDKKATFVTYYYLVFDFDIVHNGVTYPKGTAVRLTNQSRYNDGYTYFHAQVAPNETLSRDNTEHKIIIFASASNMPSNELLNRIIDNEIEIQFNKGDVSQRKYVTNTGDNTANFDTDIEYSQNHTPAELAQGKTMYGDGYYFAMKSVSVRTISKIYDFTITDCADLAYKSAFRETNTNKLASKSGYYSGIRRLLVYTMNNKEYTALTDRDNIRINGTNSTRTLPLGPYKHTTASYVNAPKLGYRIAFSLKTTGRYVPDPAMLGTRKITIKPTYYYLSKDGSNIIKDITLYYKDQTDKYKKFENSGYKIYFTPNDKSRYTNDLAVSDISYLSTKQEGLDISRAFELTDKMVALNEDSYIQTWFGEYKLPNTTIAVKNGDSINNALSNGYICVKFDITCNDSKLGQTLSYSALNKSQGSAINTTQWDYEGYLGFSNPGQPVTNDTSLRIQLEKGIWSIDSQELYDLVKGTVLLYDIDSRAADDIN